MLYSHDGGSRREGWSFHERSVYKRRFPDEQGCTNEREKID